MANKTRLAIPLVGDRSWNGGVTYVHLLATAARSLPPDEQPELAFVLRSGEEESLDLYRPFLALFDRVLLVGFPTDRAPDTAGVPVVRVADLSEAAAHIDVLYPGGSDLKGIPFASWIPDFQHRHLPHFFSAAELAQRDRQFALVARDARVCVFSSRDAENDFRALHPSSSCKAFVLHFHHHISREILEAPLQPVLDKHGLSRPFVMCCNQFWVHKDHGTLFGAFARIARKHPGVDLVCTGGTADHRAPEHFAKLRAMLDREGLADRVRILGLIPREEQLQLLRAAMGVAHPSLFEGWSTVVEDCRALGKRMVLSDLAVHREQDPPGATFFRRGDQEDLAAKLDEALANWSPGPDLADESRARAESARNLERFGRRLLELCEEVRAAFGPEEDALAGLEEAARWIPNDPTAAENALDRPAVRDSRDVRVQRAAGNLLLRAGRTNAARSRFALACRLAPDDADAHLDLGVTWLLMGRYDDADASLRRALAIAPGRGDLWKALGQVHLRAGARETGVEAFRQALERIPEDPECLALVGGWHARRGEAAQARPLLEKALRLRPDDAELGQELSRLDAPSAPRAADGPVRILFAANFVPTADAAWAGRQRRCASTLCDLARPFGHGLANLRYADEPSTLPPSWKDEPVLVRSGRDLLGPDQKRKPFVTDLFDEACAAAARGGFAAFALLNSDIVVTPALLERIGRLLSEGTESIAVSRTECTWENEVPHPGRMEYLGFDLFVVSVDAWKRERARFRDYVFGERAWDDAWTSILLSHTRGALLWEPGILLHPVHETQWISGAYSDHNMALYLGLDVEYALRFRRLQREAEARGLTDRARFDPADLVERIFRRPLSDRPVVSVVVSGNGDPARLWKTVDSILATTWEPHILSAIDQGEASRPLLEKLHREGFLRAYHVLAEDESPERREDRLRELRDMAAESVVVEAGFEAVDGNWLPGRAAKAPRPKLDDRSPEILRCEERALRCAQAGDLAGFSDACGEMVVLAAGDPSVLHRLEPVLAQIRRPPQGRESALAHRLLDGLRGLEIGGSAHNPFGLGARNVGMIHRGYIAEQIRACGSCLPIDLETDAAALPVPDESEDFVVSSHVLEHTTDVARTLLDWYRAVRPGGYLHIVVPLPGASRADDDKPPVTWRHVFEDLVQGATPEMEPEQDAPGNNHYHLLALSGLEEACRHLFGERCEVVARQEIDDKVGNGCTLVLRKRVGLDGAFPWKVAAGGHGAEIVRRVARTGVSLLDTDLASRRRHALEEPLPPPEVRAAALAEWNGGWDERLARGARLPVVLGADPRTGTAQPAWFREGCRQGMARLEPLGVEWIEASPGASGFGTLAETGFRRAEAREAEWFGVLLSPCLPTPRLLALLRQKMTSERDVILVGADRIRELDARGVPIAGEVSPRRIDLVLVRAAAWRAVAPSIPPEATAPDLLCAFARNARTLPILRGGHLVGLPDGAAPVSRDPLWNAWIAGDWTMGVPYKDDGEALLQRLAQEHPEGASEEHRLVNIGMITYNRLEFTRQTLDSLHEHTAFPHVLTVVDNNSTDGSREYLQEQKRLGRIDNLVLLDENVGVAKASNLAWSLVPEATHYLKLDNDIVLRKDGWLDEMVRVVDALPEVGVVAYSFEPISFPLVEIRGVRIRPKNGNLGGACILIPKRTEERLGVWCEDFGIYGEEDLDYGFRVQMSGLLNAYMEDEDMGFHLPAGKAAVIDTGTWLAADGKEELVHAEYRRMKDENRARNHQSGIVEANFKAYLAGTKSVKLESGFVRARREREAGAEAPMTVLVCTLNPPMNCCGYLRIVQHLRRAPGVTALWNPGNADPADFARALERCDIVLVQRGFVENRPAMDAVRASGKPWVFEIDDLLWEELPSWNPHAEEFRAIAPQLVSALREATATIASTTTLGERLEELSRDVHVVPNLLDPEVWPVVPRRQGSDKLLVAYAGTATHTADLLLVEEVLERLSRVHGDKLDFVFLGCVTPRLARLPGARLVEFSDDYAAYARNLAGLGIDIALAPLRDHPFNRAKSAIKWLEYSACRAAGVYADLPAYRDVVRDGENGFLAGASADEWFERLDRLVRDPELRRKLSDTAHDEARSLHALDPAASPLVRALRTIRAESKRPAPDAASVAGALPRVSVVIPVHGKLDLTRDCVGALRRTTDPATTEIVVVDDASPDGTAVWLREREAAGELRAVLLSANRGFAHACNAGARAARGGILVFLNNDTLPEPGWLEALVAPLAKDPAVGMVGARLLYPDRTVQHAGIHFHPGGMPFHVHRGAAAGDPAVLREAAFPAVTGACVAMPADLYRQLGGFDESYRMYVEDVDLCLKVWEAGREVRYCPGSVVVHLESASSTDLERRDALVREGLGKLHATWSGRWPQALRKVDGFPASFFATAASSPARVRWISPVWDPSGYADESRAFLKHLASTDLGVSARPWGRHSETFHQAAPASDRSILDAALSREALPGSPVVLDIPAHALGRVEGAGHHVGRTTFETDGLPSDWVARCNLMDEIWVPCRFNRETFAKAGVTKPILVVPEGVDTDKFRPGLAPLDLPGPNRRVTYLAVFEWTHRKAPDLLLRAWAEAFAPSDDVKLVLRTYPPNQIEGDPAAWVDAKIDEGLARVGKRRADCAPIAVIAKQVPDADMPRLYAAADVYLAPSRGEGWGRPHMEAMGCGVPVIATRWSGNLDFQTDDNSWLIDIDGLEEIDAREEFPFYRGQKWATPSLPSFVRALRQSRDDQGLRRAKGERARRDMVENWDWSRIAHLAEIRLREILAGVPAADSRLHRASTPRTRTTDSVKSIEPIRWAGPVFNYSGYARLARETLKGLMDAGVAVSCDPQLNDKEFFAALSGKDAEIARWKGLLATNPVPGPLVVCDLPRDAKGGDILAALARDNAACGKRICWTMFETDRLPTGWADALNTLDEVWVPSHFNRATFARSGVAESKIHVIPGCIDAAPYANARPASLPGSGYTFLSVFQWIERKGWDVLLDAWARAFKPHDPVRLVLRCHPFGKAEPVAKQLDQFLSKRGLRREDLAPLHLIEEFVPDDALPGLFASSDCFVLPSRGEGWGLPYLEAMASGKPVIGTRWSAQVDFLTPDNSWLLSPRDPVAVGEGACREVPFLDPSHRWADPSPDELAKLLRHAFEHPEEGRAKGRQGQRDAIAKWTPAQTARAIVERLAAEPEPAQAPTTTTPSRAPASSSSDRQVSVALARVADGLKGKAPASATDPLPNPASSDSFLSLRWEGSQFVHHSLAHVNRELCLRLAKAGHDLSIVPFEPDQFGPGADPDLALLAQLHNAPLEGPCQVHVRHQWPPNLVAPPEGKWVVVQPWEFGSPPKEWIPVFSRRIDQLWAYTTHVRDMYLEAGVPAGKVKVVPLGVDCDKFRPGIAPFPLRTRKSFKFLYVGGTIARKGFDLLLEAWKTAFGPDDDVCLVVKDMGGGSFYKGQTAKDWIMEMQDSGNFAEIEYLEQDLDPGQIPSLYVACDVLVHPYRGEGFGLPIAEAMACGLPCVVTRGGAADDFCGEAESWGVRAERVPVPGGKVGPFETVAAPWWLEPSVEHLADRMREARRDNAARETKGRAARERIERDFTWENAAAIAEGTLRDLVRDGDKPARTAEGKLTISSLEKLARSITAHTPKSAAPPVRTPDDELEEMGRLLVQAEAAAARGSMDEAERLTATAVERHPAQNMAWLARAMVLRGLGKFAKATEAIEKSLACRETPDALLEAMQIHLLAKQNSGARKAEKALKERHGAWFQTTRTAFREAGKPWPPDFLKPSKAAPSGKRK